MSEDDLVITFIPALITLLVAAERSKASPLTEAEVLEIRDNGVCMMLKRSDRDAVAERRGYADLDAGQIWEQWRAVRTQLNE